LQGIAPISNLDILICGGRIRERESVRDCYIFNINTKALTATDNLHQEGNFQGFISVNRVSLAARNIHCERHYDMVICAGGMEQSGPSYDTVDIYDIATKTWRPNDVSK